MRNTKISKEYIAGFVDGEAYIGIKRNIFKKEYSPTYIENISICQKVGKKSKIVLEHIAKQYGGKIYTKKGYESQKSQNPMYVLELNYGKAVSLLMDIEKFSFIKKDNIKNVIKLYERKQKLNNGKKKLTDTELIEREKLWIKSKSLNGNK